MTDKLEEAARRLADEVHVLFAKTKKFKVDVALSPGIQRRLLRKARDLKEALEKAVRS